MMVTCGKHSWQSLTNVRCPHCEAECAHCDIHPGQTLPCASCAVDNMRRKSPLPTMREFRLFTVVGDPSVEVTSLIAQIMDSYKDITASEHNAVVGWFTHRYPVT